MKNLSILCLKSEKNELGSMYGKFVIGALIKGQGLTIGNLFRRVLLNDLGSTAITGVRITNIKDEFSTIPGVREDILEILLNLKGVVLKNKIDSIQFARLKIKGPAIITANQIKLPKELELVNPNHYIATISDTTILELELKIESGTGYKLINQSLLKKSNEFLQIDAIFMPIQQVNFKIENVYDNLNNRTERLLIDIWTNGSITPDDAIVAALKSTVNLLNSILDFKLSKKTTIYDKDKKFVSQNPHTNIAIEELHLSVRAYNCLKRAQINTIGDLLKYSPEKLQELKNFGRKSADEVFTSLKNKLGIILI